MKLENAVVDESMDRADGFVRIAPWAIAGSALLLTGAIAAGIAIYKHYSSSSDSKPSVKVAQNYGGQK
ncbi:MAG: hypothetical protein MUF61_00020 [archaeon]|jgi:hypothetical protein|nr:hypothetical protein [archaeon]